MTYTREKDRHCTLCGVKAQGISLGSVTVKKTKAMARYCISNATKHDAYWAHELLHHSPNTISHFFALSRQQTSWRLAFLFSYMFSSSDNFWRRNSYDITPAVFLSLRMKYSALESLLYYCHCIIFTLKTPKCGSLKQNYGWSQHVQIFFFLSHQSITPHCSTYRTHCQWHWEDWVGSRMKPMAPVWSRNHRLTSPPGAVFAWQCVQATL